MVCERCQKKESTVHLTEIIKSVRSEVHLCEECAREIGFNSKISDLTSFIFSNQRESDIRKLVCPLCGTDAYEVTESSHMGCPVCYQVFASAVSVLSGDHYYAGKKPDNTGVVFNIHDIKNEYVKRDDSVSLDSLKRSLDEAIKDERYEDAAVIRDLIKEKEGSFRV
jgi:protein arginine kinase activator